MISAADQKFLLPFKKCILLVQVDGRLQILLLSLEFLFGMLLAILCTILSVVLSVVASSEINWASLALLVMYLTNRYEEAEGSSVLLYLLVSLSCLLTPRYWRCFLCTIHEATKRINNQEQMVNFFLIMWICKCRLGICNGCNAEDLCARLEALLVEQLEPFWFCCDCPHCVSSSVLILLPWFSQLVCIWLLHGFRFFWFLVAVVVDCLVVRSRNLGLEEFGCWVD